MNLLMKDQMKTKKAVPVLSLFLAYVPPESSLSKSSVSYIIGGIIALFILGYLVYTLLKPEKF